MARFTVDQKKIKTALLGRNKSIFELSEQTGIPYIKLKNFLIREREIDSMSIYFAICEWLGVSLYHFVKDSQSDKVVGDLAQFKRIMES